MRVVSAVVGAFVALVTNSVADKAGNSMIIR